MIEALSDRAACGSRSLLDHETLCDRWRAGQVVALRGARAAARGAASACTCVTASAAASARPGAAARTRAAARAASVAAVGSTCDGGRHRDARDVVSHDASIRERALRPQACYARAEAIVGRIGNASAISIALLLGCGGSSTNDAAAGGAGGGSGGSSGSAGSGATCGAPAWKACTGPMQCVLATDDCCLCGMPELQDFEAIHQNHASKCTCDGPVCGCATALNPNLAASCENGQCVAWDVRTTAKYSACTDDTQCKLRMGLECCESCQGGEWGLVAIRSDSESALVAAACAPNTGCDDCVPAYPPDAHARCVAGFCSVVVIQP